VIPSGSRRGCIASSSTACYIEVRRTRRWTVNVRALPDQDGPSTPDASRLAADRDELERAFHKLPIDQRSVFVLHHYVGLPLVEVAETLGIPAGTARSRLHFATRALRSAVEAGRHLPIEEGRLA
jgi:RNA polymerase sigma-70 factor (ECF subfamily)